MNTTDDDNDDIGLFRKLFGDIERIHDDRQQKPSQAKKPRPLQQQRQTGHAYEDNLLAESMIDAAETATPEYRASGLQNTQMEKLRRGKIRPEAILDLHGMTREAALQEMQEFLLEARRHHLRCIQIVHGKGYRSADGKAILKPAVANWLKQMNGIMAYCPALPKDGGDGAVYVLLKRLREDQ